MSESVDLTGIYKAEGTQGARIYGAEAAITKLGDVYQIQWRSGPNTWTGIGVVQGNVLAVALLGGGAGEGVIAYEIESSGDSLVLRGIWAYAEETNISTETLYRVRGAASPPPPKADEASWKERARRAFPRAGG